MGWESTNVMRNWNGSGTGPVARSHHRANRSRSGTGPLRSHREVVVSFRNDKTHWNRCVHGRPVAFQSRSGLKPNGLVEKCNGRLNAMLKRMTHERPGDWDRCIPALMFAYREVPQESITFSRFELYSWTDVDSTRNMDW